MEKPGQVSPIAARTSVQACSGTGHTPEYLLCEKPQAGNHPDIYHKYLRFPGATYYFIMIRAYAEKRGTSAAFGQATLAGKARA